MTRRLHAAAERWPLREAFTISRGSKTEAEVVTVSIQEGHAVGRGECVPYARYGETVPGVLAQIDQLTTAVAAGLTRADVNERLPPGAARNALDCALWDLEAKQTGQPVWQLAGLPQPGPIVTAYTLSMAAPDVMAAAARASAHLPLLKVKLGPTRVIESVTAIRAAAPGSELIVDANEAWTAEQLELLLPALRELGVALLEQPLPVDADQVLAELARAVPVAADESCHVAADVARLADRYDAVNIKLDKAGGLTAALELKATAEAAGLEIMIGSMVATSLAVAPAMLLAPGARYVDLDGPLLLARDRSGGVELREQRLQPPIPALWG